MKNTLFLPEVDRANRVGKATVFTDMFSIARYAVRLARALRRGLDITEADIKILTLNSVLMVKPFNDIGLLVKGEILICSEAQSTWSLNIVVRMLLYLAETYHRYIQSHPEFNIYGSKKIKPPRPVCHVIYTGQEPNRPQSISLAKEFFGRNSPLDLKVTVLSKPGTYNIVGEYIRFCHVFNESIQRYGYSKEAITKTIDTCQQENVLVEYLTERRKEVEDIMFTLFSQEDVTTRYGNECREEGRREGHTDGIMI